MKIIVNKLKIVILLTSIISSMAVGQIISQYIETDSGTTPKGIEIWNNTAGVLNFSTNNLVIEKGVNGAAPSADYTLSTGTLAVGAVIVIGTSDLQTITESNGATFYTKGFTFNGDDALVVKYGGTTTDMFGTAGSDPGSAWSGSGVSSANQNIKLKSDITTGDTDGWTDPSTRFEIVSTNPSADKSDFGVSPASTSAPDAPTSFTATAASSSQINLTWTDNSASDDVMVVFDSDGSFTDPVDGTSYSSSALGGTVIYQGTAEAYNHTSLTGATQYFYKAWSVDGDDNYSSGVTDDATTIKAEPSNHASTFASTSDHNSITVTWADNDGAVVADGYLVKASSTSLAAITAPSDATAESDDTDLSNGSAVVNVTHGTETYEFTGLSSETTYYFKIWPYSNSASNIDYKIDGTIPSQSKATTAAPATPKVFISEMCDPQVAYATNRYIEIYNAGIVSVNFTGWKVVAIINDGSTETFTWNLSGSIASGDALVCGDDGNTLITCDFAETDWSSSNSSWNGKAGDGAKLYNGTTLIDDASSHGSFENKTTQRNASVTSPTTTFSSAEWTGTSTTNYENATPGSHTCDEPASTAPDDPTTFSATATSASQINLSWTQNGDTDNVMVIFDSDGSFTDPSDGTSYSVSSSACGGTVIFNGSATSYNHTSLSGGTHYYYKAWSVDGSNNYSSGVTDNATTIKAEPSNHASTFASTSDHNSITVSWSDNDGAVVADGYLVKVSSTSLVAITAPSDATAESDDTDLSDGSAVVNVTHGTETYEFTGLSSETTYYFKIWPYSNSASNIDYKTDGTVPSQSKATTAAPSYILNLDFESSGGYTTSATEFGLDGDTYFERTDGTDVTDSFTNTQGSYFFAAQDIDGNSDTPPLYLTIEDVDISDYTDLEFSIYLAEGDDGSNQDWDSGDYMHITYDIDNTGSFTNLLWVENDGTTFNTVPLIDTDFDGDGDGTEITAAFTEHTASITGTGSSVDIKIEFSGLTSADEDIALDNIRLTGTAGATSVDNPTSFTATATSASQINLTWTDNSAGDEVIVVFDSDGSFTDPVDGNSYTGTALGGTVIYQGTAESYNHTSLSGATQYYYKAWSVDGSDNYSSGVTDDATTIKAEPSNHASTFASTSDHNSITVSWSDNDGAVAADGYLVKASSTSLVAITAPSDATAESDDTDLSDGSAVVNVTHGTETYEFTGLSSETTYYFKIWPYSNSASNIDYKTDGTIPSQSKTTTETPPAPIVFISEVSDPKDVANAKFVELYNSGGSSVDLSTGNWYLARQANGSTWGNIALSGSIAAGSTFVIANNSTDFEASFTGVTADQYNATVSGNGDDGYFLYSGGNNTSGTLIDAYGVIDENGTGKDWEYLDARAERNSDISEPNTTWTSSEWTITDPGNVADCTPGEHTITISSVDAPSSFTASAASASQINLSWTKNGDSDNVMVVFDSDGSFTNPVDETAYSVSASACGGTVIYNGSGTSFSHSSLSGGTTYYYKAWSVDGSNNYSTGVTDNETTVKAEPSNHVSDFSASSNHISITLTWTDHNGAIAADGFLIKASSTSLAAISAPSDATAESDDTDLSDGSAVVNVTHGTETYEFSGLNASTTYYFKIWPYTNSGSNIDYKTDEAVPSGSKTTLAPIKIIITEVMKDPNTVGDTEGEWFEIYNSGAETVNIDGWTIKDDGSDSHTIDNGGTLNIASGDFLVLGINNTTSLNGDYSCDYVYSSFQLSNNDDEIILMDGTTEIDRVAYDGGTNWPNPNGASIVFIGTAEDDNNLYSNWGTAISREAGFNGTSGDKGSPGTNGSDQALPVTLGSFSAEYKHGVIELTWTTESETDNAHFLIYQNNEVIGSLEGAGTTSETNHYLFTDVHIIPGHTYTYVLADVSYSNEETRHIDNSISIIAGDNDISMDYSIGNAFPNPFNPSTLIPVNLASDKYVHADLYDLKGRKIKTLIDQNMSAGSHELSIDGHDLATGVYVVRVLINDQLQIQKIALMK